MELNIQYFGFTGISTFLLRGTSKRCRPNVWGTFPSTSSLFVLMIFLAMTISAQSQSRCACSPSAIEFTFDFSGTCENNSIAGPGIADTNCSISPFASANVIDFVPSFLTTIDVIELGQNLQIVKQTTSSQDFFNGDTFRYESIVRDPDDLADAELPRAIEFSAVGRNRQNEQIFLIWIVAFSNDCQTFPVFSSPNQSIGWTILSSVTQPLFEFCPIAGTAAPTRSPAPIPQSSKDAPAPITQSAKDTPAPIVRMPTPVDNPAANPVVPPSLLHPTREPAVECLPSGKGSSKKSEKSGGKSGKGSSSGSKSSKSAKSAKGGECDETSGKSSKSSKSGKGKGNVFSRPPVISTSAPIEQGSGDGPEIPVSPPATSLPVTPPSGGNGGSGDGGSGDAISSADDPVVGGTQDVDSQSVQLPINSAPEDTPSANEFPSDNDGSDSSGFPSTSVPTASSTSEKAGFRQNRIRSSLLIASGVGLVVVFLGLLVSRQWHARGSIDPFKPLLLSSNTSNAYHGATTVGTSSVSHVSTMEGHDVPSIYLTETGSSRYAD